MAHACSESIDENQIFRDLPGSPVVKPSSSNSEGMGSITPWGQRNQNIKQKQYNKLNKDFKNGPHYRQGPYLGEPGVACTILLRVPFCRRVTNHVCLPTLTLSVLPLTEKSSVSDF